MSIPLHHRLRIPAVLLLVASIMLSVVSCRKSLSDEDLIRGIIESAARAAVEKDIKGVTEHVSDSYKDEYGNDRDALKGLLFVYFRQYDRINVYIRDTEITVEGDRAEAAVKVVFTGGETLEEIGDVVPSSGGGYLLEIKLEREDGEWKAVRSRWTDIGFMEAL
ncbi:MAG: nuclear transport factor 2 family protein [Deltaproteobacteria bacterium]|nr:nuclear transport factor 2 family protein [Candidatus Zymogenaceae bacterium]